MTIKNHDSLTDILKLISEIESTTSNLKRDTVGKLHDPNLNETLKDLLSEVNNLKNTPIHLTPSGSISDLNVLSAINSLTHTTLEVGQQLSTTNSDVLKTYSESYLDTGKKLVLILEEIEYPDLKQLKKDTIKLSNFLTKTSQQATKLETEIQELELRAQDSINQVHKLYNSTMIELDERKTQVNELIGVISNTSIIGSYEKDARSEKRSANFFRWGSIACMGIVVVMLAELITTSLDGSIHLDDVLARLAISLALSVPAAYLARESAKHREQQYRLRQTSLDLAAISPFLASLPLEEQHKIKTEMALKIFATQEFSRTSENSFPINTHELLLELIKRLEPSKPGK
ncbi:hypothetical protein [Pseudomonas oryziphila]|uniref:Uncharacterized protein n=1 Tax=Pseudomonas entomophila TaxID=312306 RepID=A0A3S8UI61_9PSED|nr:hypothetical protein [Pseudomonas oryziphila]AZL67971.1 hypothetical protein EJA05_09535 [Pseudomonas oryziphila]